MGRPPIPKPFSRKRSDERLPPLTDPQELPRDLATARLIEINGWWLEVRCTCGRSAALPLRLLSADERDTQLRTYICRLVCQGCGSRVSSARLVDNPGLTGNHHGGGPQANMVDIKFR